MLHRPASEVSRESVATRLLSDAEALLDRDPQRARACLRQLAAWLADASGGAPADRDGATVVRGGLAPWQTRRVEKYVDERLCETITISDLADLLRLSSGHFCRAFKISSGLTPHTYIVLRRIERAKTLMLTTTETLSQIAVMSGLTDQAHLTRLFRRHVGTTPLSWRRANRQAS